MNTAVLMGPKYGNSVILDEEEYQAVTNVLRLYRSDDKGAPAIRYALEGATEKRIIEHNDGNVVNCLLDLLMEGLGKHLDEVQGLIVGFGGDTTCLLKQEGKRQLGCVKALLTILRAEGWFADYLQFWLLEFAKNPPMPLEVMDSLSEPACNFDYDVKDTKAMLRKWPQLFAQSPAQPSKSDLSQLAEAIS